MKKFIRPICLALLTAVLLQPVLAQVGAGGGVGGRRVQGQGINYAPQSEVYAVLAIDLQDRTVQLRALNLPAPAGWCAVWFTHRGFCLGLASGLVFYPQADRVSGLPLGTGELFFLGNRLLVLSQ